MKIIKKQLSHKEGYYSYENDFTPEILHAIDIIILETENTNYTYNSPMDYSVTDVEISIDQLKSLKRPLTIYIYGSSEFRSSIIGELNISDMCKNREFYKLMNNRDWVIVVED